MLQQIGLYYPYIHLRNEQWLKTAALYWPKLARVVPTDYPLADSDTVRALMDDLDFIVPVEPTMTANAVAPMFRDVLERHAHELRERYGFPTVPFPSSPVVDDLPHVTIGHIGPSFAVGDGWAHRGVEYLPHSGFAPSDREIDAEPRPPRFPEGSHSYTDTGAEYSPRVSGIYWDEVSGELRTALFEAELAVPTRRSRFSQINPRPWVAMDTALAWVYKCVFVEALARQGRFVPTTDQPAAHLASDGWDADRITAALLGDPAPTPAPAQDPACTVGMLAIRVVVPDNLADVPVQKIVKLRSRHRSEFEAFNTAITETVDALRSELAEVTLPEARDRYIQLEVSRRFALPLEDLRRAMKGLGIETAFSAANLKFELPAAASAVGGGALAGQPVVGAALGAVFAVAGLRRAATQQRHALLATSPTAYLLSIERGLEPSSLLRRLTGGLPGLPRT
ncbi:DUF6236 family protein [Streptomyces mirabilis]|uniref:DUF6236 family protein n=1 Tax=Streptomyces mirabilis TaxID=68239 RepID=UPI0036A94E26